MTNRVGEILGIAILGLVFGIVVGVVVVSFILAIVAAYKTKKHHEGTKK